MNHADCFARHIPPKLAVGERLTTGSYLRCLQKDDPKRLYRDDDGKYGYRVRPEKWRWSAEVQDGFSVTENSCATCLVCALAYHPKAADYCHVLKIDLAELIVAIDVALVAVFDPIKEGPENPCHFVIVPTDVPVFDLIEALREFMVDEFPPPPKAPRLLKEIDRAVAARAQYDRVFRISLDVRTPREGEPDEPN